MSDFKLTFKLKQHTPLIHFQHDQAGATLRAKELKPKLDRFLIGKFKKEKIDYSKWLIPGQEKALDYKVRVDKINIYTQPINKNQRPAIPFFFGNMGRDYKDGDLGLTYYDSEINCIISTFNIFNDDNNKGILDYIDEFIVEFFELSNFGTRQSKGYGSFTVAEIVFKNEKRKIDFDSGKFIFNFKFTFTDPNFDNFIQTFEKVEWFYKSLRGGINLKGRANYEDIQINGSNEKHVSGPTVLYLKSILFLYLYDKGIQWDKKTIKENFFNYFDYYKRRTSRKEYKNLRLSYVYEDGLKKQKEKYPNADVFEDVDNGEKFLWRDLFGLSTNEEWRSYGATIEKKSASKNNANCIELVKNDPDKIERFKSPIFIKPIFNNNQLTFYFRANPINPQFLNQWFIISKGNRHYDNFCIRTPSKFSFSYFFDWMLSNFNLKEQIIYDSRNKRANEIFEILEDIFNQIQVNKQ